MHFKELLNLINTLANDLQLATPYIVGGVPRDVCLKSNIEFNDFDITTGNADVVELARAFAEKVGVHAKDLGERHLQVSVDGIKFDFSSNFSYDNIDDLLAAAKVKDVDDLTRETYSRDFTINTLLLTLDLNEVVDLTGRGLKDLEDKILDCPLDCDESFKESPNRILRAYYYKAKYGFEFSKSVKSSIAKNLDLLKEVNPRYAGEMLNAILRANADMVHELIEQEVLHHMPLTKLVTKVLLENRRILDII